MLSIGAARFELLRVTATAVASPGLWDLLGQV